MILNGNGTLAERVTKRAETTEFVLKAYAPSLLRQRIDQLDLWSRQPHVQVGALCGYFTQYLYMPRVRDHDVVWTAIRHLSKVLLPEQDGFAYADSVDDDGRYRGLTLGAPSVVSGTGLVVDPRIAIQQIEEAVAAGTASRGGEASRGTAGGGAGGVSAAASK